MAYLTARKRATGLGSAKDGTRHFWEVTVQAVALLVLIPLFVFTIGPLLGAPYEVVVARLSQPIPAVIVLLTFVVGLRHFRSGAQVLIEDYTGGLTRKVALIAVICLSYALMAAAIVAIARIAL